MVRPQSLPYGHRTVSVPGALWFWWKSVSEMPLLPGNADLQKPLGWHSMGGSTVLRGLLGTWQGASGWLRAKCSCTAETVEYLEHCS